MPERTVFFISDGTGITAETFGNAILAQFEVTPRHVRLPFTDTPDKAHQAVRQINAGAVKAGCDLIARTPDDRPNWSYAGGVFVQGLQNRRQAERALCLEAQP